MISAYGKAGEWEKAMSLFHRAEDAGVKLDCVAFNALIDACARGNQWDRARGVFQEMEAAEVEPDVVTYTSLIRCTCTCTPCLGVQIVGGRFCFEPRHGQDRLSP